MIPEFKKGTVTKGLLEGILAIESVLNDAADSNPALTTDFPEGIAVGLSSEHTPRNIGFAVGILVIALIVHFVLNEKKIYKERKWMWVLYGLFVLSIIWYFFPDAVFYLFCFGVFAGNLYLLYGLWSPLSYFYSCLSILFWIPFIHFTFKADLNVLFWVFGIISLILYSLKIALDDTLINYFDGIAKKLGSTPKGLVLHILAFFTFGFAVFSFWNGESFLYILFYQGLLLFSIYGLGKKSFSFKYLHYFAAFFVWSVVVVSIFFFLPDTNTTPPTYDPGVMVLWLKWFICLVFGYIMATAIEVDSWKYRFLKYAFMSLVWTIGFSIHYLLGYSEHWSYLTFVFSYVSLLVLHFLYVIANETGSGSYSSSSSSSSSRSSSYSSASSYSSSSSSRSSSSGGGGGSFGGGGSSGSW